MPTTQQHTSRDGFPIRLKPNYWTARRVFLALLCIVVHAAVVLNVWQANKLTPRNINVTIACPKSQHSGGVRI